MKIPFCALLLISIASPAFAVPVPWVNCGAAGDVVTFSQVDVSRWPPGVFGPPFPIYAVANFSPRSGELTRLRVALIAPGWLFDLSNPPHGIRSRHGFVALPTSWLTNLSPEMPFSTVAFNGFPSGVTWQTALPVPAGPHNDSVTLPPFDPSGTPLSGEVKLVVGSAFQSPSKVSLSFNGVEGFPISPGPGLYSVTLKNVEPSAQEVFCIRQTTADTPLVTVEPIPFRDFDTAEAKIGKQLQWEYGRSEDDSPFRSEAMDPEVYHRPCGEPVSEDERIDGDSQYDEANRTWFLNWNTSEVDSDCEQISIRSRLTGQTDGPFKLRL